MQLPPFIARRPWLWPIGSFVVNLAILWMISFVTSCTTGTEPQLCEATRPWSSAYPLLLIAIASSFPPSVVLLGLLRMQEIALCLIYAGFAVVVVSLTYVLYRMNYFIPGKLLAGPASTGCVICDLMFLLQIAFNLGWVFAVVPIGLIRSHQRAQRQQNKR
jgi:hypothetical protein